MVRIGTAIFGPREDSPAGIGSPRGRSPMAPGTRRPAGSKDSGKGAQRNWRSARLMCEARSFKKKFKGCDPDEVKQFLDAVADRMEPMLKAKEEAREGEHRSQGEDRGLLQDGADPQGHAAHGSEGERRRQGQRRAERAEHNQGSRASRPRSGSPPPRARWTRIAKHRDMLKSGDHGPGRQAQEPDRGPDRHSSSGMEEDDQRSMGTRGAEGSRAVEAINRVRWLDGALTAQAGRRARRRRRRSTSAETPDHSALETRPAARAHDHRRSRPAETDGYRWKARFRVEGLARDVRS